MAVSKQQKVEILAGLTTKFKEAKSIGFASTNTLTVAEFGELRNSLREVNASYTLAKKTLIIKAIKDALDIDIDLSTLPGQIGVVCSNDDAIAGLGKVNDLVKSTKGKKISWTVSIFEGELKDNEETKAIAGMPSRDTLLSRMVGSLQSPLSGMARWFDAAAKDLEEQGKSKVSQLESDTSTKEETPVVKEEKEETKEELAEKTEEKKEDAPVKEEKK